MFHRMRIGVMLFLLFVSINCLAQSKTASHDIEIQIREVALIGLSSNSSDNINFSPFSDREAGGSLSFVGEQSNNSYWINYSSIKKSEQHSRTVTAFIQGEVPEGFNLIVTAMPAKGAGKGDLGESTGTALLGTRPTEIISGIGSCYTGTGANNGHNLVYNLEVDDSKLDFSDLKQEELTFNVVYTLSD